MNRNDWEKQVYASNMNVTARCVALVVGSFGNWNDERNVWPSTTAIADMAGLTRDTAQKYIDALVDQGWLTYVKTRTKNVKEYALAEVVAEPFGILAKAVRGNQFTKKNSQLPKQAEVVAETSNPQLPKQADVVDEPPVTNLKEPKEIELKEEPTTKSPTAGAAVDSETSFNLEEVKKGWGGMTIFLNKQQEADFLRIGRDNRATARQSTEAYRLLTTNRLPGDSWLEQCENAYIKAGTEIDQW